MQNQLTTLSQADITADNFSNIVAQANKLQKDLDKFWSQVKDQMIESKVKKVEGDFGTLTLAERKVWKTDISLLPEDYLKTVANTTKLNRAFDDNIDVPGADFTTTPYVAKRLK